jgi:lipopolysaccharide transport system ATP-binding protein
MEIDLPLLKIENLSKKFCRDLKLSLWYGFKDIVFSILGKGGNPTQLRKKEFWALKNISFEIKRGECLGLIGHNGAGKSTLLKLINGLIKPDGGKISINGKIGSLIELGAGFNPVLSGRENIYANAALLGFTNSEIDKKLDDIIAFSEIGEFIDSPVQYYSSGMKVRLGFAVAAFMQPDILIIDEVLAVGDMGFVLKCFNHIDKMLQNTAVILVSHSMPQISRMCTHLVVLDHGEVIYSSPNVSEGITAYYNMFQENISNFHGSTDCAIKKIELITTNQTYDWKDENIVIETNEAITFRLHLYSTQNIKNPDIYLAFYDQEQRNIAEVFNFSSIIALKNLEEGNHVFAIDFPGLTLTQGLYSLTIGLSSNNLRGKEVLFRHQSAVYFTVHNDIHGWAPFQLSPTWKHLSNV